MELRQLKYFLKTAETLNFSEAARSLFVTQSTLSQQIRQLEQELGVELFERDSHSVKLTESGERMYPCAKATLEDAESCFTQISDLKQMLTGVLNIGITYSFAPILTETVRDFVKLYPGVKINIICDTMENVLDLLKKREVDFVLSFRPNECDDEIESHILFDNQLAIILSQNHPLSSMTSLTLDDLRPYGIVLPAKGMQARNAFDLCFPGESDRLDVKLELNEVNVLLDLVKSTQLVTFLSEATLYQKSGLKALPFQSNNTQLEGCVHSVKKAYRKRSAEEFMRLLSASNAVMERAHNWIK
ncbi:MAG: LysR substrate-binding domain-containing protein [Bacteroidales bacterium]|nr:LysR substrate-binding domain-containing protein [Bacteroidales bacterium]